MKLHEKGGKMNIGIDVDNTIVDTLKTLKKYCKEYNEKVIKRDIQMNQKGFNISNLYDWTDEEKEKFFIEYIDIIREEAKLKPNVCEVMNKLKQEGNSIHIITARRKIEGIIKDPYETTKKFLEESGIKYDKLAVQEDKRKYCIDNNIDVLIDDELQNIYSVCDIIPVIVFNEIYNTECEGNNIIKVNTWNEVYDIIKKMRL